jgi:16S rRNA processing protein RimM
VRSDTGGEFITLARVVKTQGRHGEVAVEVHSDIPDRFVEGMRLFALLKGQGRGTEANGSTESGRFAENEARRELEVENLWPHKDWLVLKFRGVDTISEAEELAGCELQVPRSERGELGLGWTYISDLASCTVFDNGREIGQIDDVQFGAGEAPLLIVADRAGKKFDIPFAEAYLESVDLAHRQVRMRLPEGLLEINAPMTAEEKKEQALSGGGSIHPSRQRKAPRTLGHRR